MVDFQCFCINFLKDNYLFLNPLLLCIINMQFLHIRIIICKFVVFVLLICKLLFTSLHLVDTINKKDSLFKGILYYYLVLFICKLTFAYSINLAQVKEPLYETTTIIQLCPPGN